MKTTTLVHCEVCDNTINITETQKQSNKESFIFIEGGNIVKNKELLEKGKMVFPDSTYKASISGVYCSLKCLIKRIKAIMERGY